MKGLEEARQRHRPVESQLHEPPSRALSLLPTQHAVRQTNIRRRQRVPVGRGSTSTTTAAVASERDIATPTSLEASQIIAVDDFAQSQIGASFTTLEHHFSTNINAAWQKLNDYYTKTDATLIYRAAVFLHPYLKWRWFERHWVTKPQ
jgi:hypothetical protein